ncbi:MAG: FHA domain-containing protein, partial [Prevotella sp.]|nr:FHA domain-containing protein [Prevotella sp.]
MNITIGRDSNTNQLHFTSGKITANFGHNNSVSPYVSREHCRITIDDDSGQMTISNINPDNFTFVNKVAVETMIIQGDESVELGYERYPLAW